MKLWLENFAYRVEIGSVIFLPAGTIVVFIALMTVSRQAVKAALTNPVENLSNEQIRGI